MSSKEQEHKELNGLEDKVHELELKLQTERKLNEEKTAIMKKTIAETEDLARHLQNTTLALIQERQIANARAEKEKLVNKWIEKINSFFDLDSLLEACVTEIGEYLDSHRCGIILFEQDEIMAIKEYIGKPCFGRKLDDKDISIEEIKHADLRKS